MITELLLLWAAGLRLEKSGRTRCHLEDRIMIYGEMNTRNCNANGGDARRNRKKRQTERNDCSTNMGDGCVHIDEGRMNANDNQGKALEDWTRTND
jgi:hypothetical protein